MKSPFAKGEGAGSGSWLKRVLLVLAAIPLLLALLFCGLILVGMFTMLNMPGKSFQGSPPPLNLEESQIKERFKSKLKVLAGDIGERNSEKFENLNRAAQFIEDSLAECGYEVEKQEYEALGKKYRNLITTIDGANKPERIIVVGAHYDTVVGCPGADDNGTGVIAVLELARLLRQYSGDLSVRFVLFPNEEYPFFWSQAMGSYVYATRCKQRKEDILGMLALETIGYYSEDTGSQTYPIGTLGFLPEKGNFIFFVGNYRSRDFLTSSIAAFRKSATLPSEGITAYDCFRDVSRSDNNSFWAHGYPGYMVTDTANFRNPNYHLPTDTIDTIDYGRAARVVSGIKAMLVEMAGLKPVKKGGVQTSQETAGKGDTSGSN